MLKSAKESIDTDREWHTLQTEVGGGGVTDGKVRGITELIST